MLQGLLQEAQSIQFYDAEFFGKILSLEDFGDNPSVVFSELAKLAMNAKNISTIQSILQREDLGVDTSGMLENIMLEIFQLDSYEYQETIFNLLMSRTNFGVAPHWFFMDCIRKIHEILDEGRKRRWLDIALKKASEVLPYNKEEFLRRVRQNFPDSDSVFSKFEEAFRDGNSS